MARTSRSLQLGVESTYNTAVSPTKAFEVTNDDWALARQAIEQRDTDRVGAAALLEHNQRWTNMGAGGSIQMAVYDNGMGLLFANIFSTKTAPAAVTSTTQNKRHRTYQVNATHPAASFTARRVRDRVNATSGAGELEEFTYAGCVPTAINFALGQKEKMTLGVTFDGASEASGGSATAAVYHATAQEQWIADDCKITLDGTELPWFNNFSLDIAYAWKTDMYTFSGTGNKQKPVQQGVPVITGSLGSPAYTDTLKADLYDKFRAGESVPLIVELAKGSTSAPDQDILRFSLPQIRFGGNTPQGSGQDITMIEGPFEALHTGASSNFPLTIYLQNDDAADS